jgi:hypothetical protein
MKPLDLAGRAVDVDWANFALGNESYAADGGTFVRNPKYPGIYDANHVAHIEASTPSEIDALMARVEEDFAGIAYRRFETDFRTPPQFLARLALEGYTRDEALTMLLEGGLLGHDRLLPQCQSGDVLLIATAGAYGHAMSSNYNLRAPAEELLL